MIARIVTAFGPFLAIGAVAAGDLVGDKRQVGATSVMFGGYPTSSVFLRELSYDTNALKF